MTHWQNNTRRFGSFHTIMGGFAHPGCTGLKQFPHLVRKVREDRDKDRMGKERLSVSLYTY